MIKSMLLNSLKHENAQDDVNQIIQLLSTIQPVFSEVEKEPDLTLQSLITTMSQDDRTSSVQSLANATKLIVMHSTTILDMQLLLMNMAKSDFTTVVQPMLKELQKSNSFINNWLSIIRLLSAQYHNFITIQLELESQMQMVAQAVNNRNSDILCQEIKKSLQNRGVFPQIVAVNVAISNNMWDLIQQFIREYPGKDGIRAKILMAMTCEKDQITHTIGHIDYTDTEAYIVMLWILERQLWVQPEDNQNLVTRILQFIDQYIGSNFTLEKRHYTTRDLQIETIRYNEISDIGTEILVKMIEYILNKEHLDENMNTNANITIGILFKILIQFPLGFLPKLAHIITRVQLKDNFSQNQNRFFEILANYLKIERINDIVKVNNLQLLQEMTKIQNTFVDQQTVVELFIKSIRTSDDEVNLKYFVEICVLIHRYYKGQKSLEQFLFPEKQSDCCLKIYSFIQALMLSATLLQEQQCINIISSSLQCYYKYNQIAVIQGIQICNQICLKPLIIYGDQSTQLFLLHNIFFIIFGNVFSNDNIDKYKLDEQFRSIYEKYADLLIQEENKQKQQKNYVKKVINLDEFEYQNRFTGFGQIVNLNAELKSIVIKKLNQLINFIGQEKVKDAKFRFAASFIKDMLDRDDFDDADNQLIKSITKIWEKLGEPGQETMITVIIQVVFKAKTDETRNKYMGILKNIQKMEEKPLYNAFNYLKGNIDLMVELVKQFPRQDLIINYYLPYANEVEGNDVQKFKTALDELSGQIWPQNIYRYFSSLVNEISRFGRHSAKQGCLPLAIFFRMSTSQIMLSKMDAQCKKKLGRVFASLEKAIYSVSSIDFSSTLSHLHTLGEIFPEHRRCFVRCAKPLILVAQSSPNSLLNEHLVLDFLEGKVQSLAEVKQIQAVDLKSTSYKYSQKFEHSMVFDKYSMSPVQLIQLVADLSIQNLDAKHHRERFIYAILDQIDRQKKKLLEEQQNCMVEQEDIQKYTVSEQLFALIASRLSGQDDTNMQCIMLQICMCYNQFGKGGICDEIIALIVKIINDQRDYNLQLVLSYSFVQAFVKETGNNRPNLSEKILNLVRKFMELTEDKDISCITNWPEWNVDETAFFEIQEPYNLQQQQIQIQDIKTVFLQNGILNAIESYSDKQDGGKLNKSNVIKFATKIYLDFLEQNPSEQKTQFFIFFYFHLNRDDKSYLLPVFNETVEKLRYFEQYLLQQYLLALQSLVCRDM